MGMITSKLGVDAHMDSLATAVGQWSITPGIQQAKKCQNSDKVIGSQVVYWPEGD